MKDLPVNVLCRTTSRSYTGKVIEAKEPHAKLRLPPLKVPLGSAFQFGIGTRPTVLSGELTLLSQEQDEATFWCTHSSVLADRRSEPRFEAKSHWAFVEEGQGVKVRISNVSSSGLALVSPTPVEVGQILLIRFDQTHPVMSLQAQVTWTRWPEGLSAARHGLSLVSVSPQALQAWRIFVEHVREFG
ncbi:MAG: PilZ domain-containing protein [Fimbriimonadaceae bacterium]|nr:PilZ domain-containing protein [Fimbriimonadaceae bacterium]